MSDDLCGIDTTYLLMHVEIAHTLGEKMRESLAGGARISRGEEHRLLESVRAIAEMRGEHPHDVWAEYAGFALCGPGCDHKENP